MRKNFIFLFFFKVKYISKNFQTGFGIGTLAQNYVIAQTKPRKDPE